MAGGTIWMKEKSPMWATEPNTFTRAKTTVVSEYCFKATNFCISLVSMKRTIGKWNELWHVSVVTGIEVSFSYWERWYPLGSHPGSIVFCGTNCHNTFARCSSVREFCKDEHSSNTGKSIPSYSDIQLVLLIVTKHNIKHLSRIHSRHFHGCSLTIQEFLDLHRKWYFLKLIWLIYFTSSCVHTGAFSSTKRYQQPSKSYGFFF